MKATNGISKPNHHFYAASPEAIKSSLNTRPVVFCVFRGIVTGDFAEE